MTRAYIILCSQLNNCAFVENPVDLTRVSPEEDSPLTLVVSTWNISCSPSTEVVSYEADPSWSRKDNENCIARTIIETFSDVLILQEAPEKLDQMLSARIWVSRRVEEDSHSLQFCRIHFCSISGPIRVVVRMPIVVFLLVIVGTLWSIKGSR